MKSVIKRIDERLRVMICIIIWKQWKVPKKRQWGLRKLGVDQWQAHMLAYAKGYMEVVRLAPIKKAISKEILTRRGLVSAEDYYLERYALKLS